MPTQRKGRGQIDSYRAFPHTALSAHNHDLVTDVKQFLLQPDLFVLLLFFGRAPALNITRVTWFAFFTSHYCHYLFLVA
jgi:hypothetical protein